MGELGSPWALVAALVVGGLIGTVGIGGVLLAPALIVVDGLGPHVAIATALWSFLFAGIAGTVVYARRGSLDRRAAMILMVTVVPGTVGGALLGASLPGSYLVVGLAALVLASGCYTLVPTTRADRATRSLGRSDLLPTGAVVGFGSALFGSSGPIFLVPILLVRGVPALLAVGISQVIQLPIVLSATAAFAATGDVNFPLGLALGVPLVVGVVAGARIAHAVRPGVLRQVVASALVGAGLLMGVRALVG